MRPCRVNSILFLVLGLACTSASVAQSVDPVEELKACARMTDQDSRTACFDELGDRVLQEDSVTEIPPPETVAQPQATPAAAAATTAPSVPDDRDDSRSAEQPSSTNDQLGGLVKSCKQGHYGNWFFIFENGQVWKEVNNRKLRFKNCNFHATIRKDRFGYEMKIDGEERTIRVRRN